VTVNIRGAIKTKMLAYLKNVYAFSEDAAAGLYEKFEQNVRQCHQTIQTSLKGEDRVALKSEIHALKGVLLNGGLSEEGDLAGIIEKKVLEGTELADLSRDIRSLFNKLVETVDTGDRAKALIVDDMAFVREFVKKSLAKLFPTMMTIEAETGEAALKLIETESFDLIICDWEHPGINGLDILGHLRGNARTKNTPFMMLTANGDREHVMQALQQGANDYLVKPVKLDTLAAKVRKLVFPGS
jgi:CheY-like chemotaxis protein